MLQWFTPAAASRQNANRAHASCSAAMATQQSAPRRSVPDFELPSTSGGPVGLADLRAAGPVVLVFASEECPTCAMALRRLAPVVGPLRAAGVVLAAVFEDPPEVAARVARRTGFAGTTLAEPAPYDVSRAFGLETLPTTVLVGRAGVVERTVVGWDADALQDLFAAAVRHFRHDVEAGMVGVNIGVAAPVAFFPFSGWKDSFLGDLHAHGPDAVEFFTRKKTVTSRFFSSGQGHGKYFVEN